MKADKKAKSNSNIFNFIKHIHFSNNKHAAYFKKSLSPIIRMNIRELLKLVTMVLASNIICSTLTFHTGQLKPLVSLIFICISNSMTYLMLDKRSYLFNKLIGYMSIGLMSIYMIILFFDIENLFEISFAVIIVILIQIFYLQIIGFMASIYICIFFISLYGSFIKIRIIHNYSSIYKTQYFTNYNYDYAYANYLIRNYIELKNVIVLSCLLGLVVFVGFYIRVYRKIISKLNYSRVKTLLKHMEKSKSNVANKKHWIKGKIISKMIGDFIKSSSSLMKSDYFLFRHYTDVAIMKMDVRHFNTFCLTRTSNVTTMIINSLFIYMEQSSKMNNVEFLSFFNTSLSYLCGAINGNFDPINSIVNFAKSSLIIITEINRHHKINLKARIGLHFGSINVVVVGYHRFHVDMFSYDNTITESIRDTCKYDNVRLSDKIKNRCTLPLHYSDAPKVKAKHEVKFGIAGSKLEKVTVPTFYIVEVNTKSILYCVKEIIDQYLQRRLTVNKSFVSQNMINLATSTDEDKKGVHKKIKQLMRQFVLRPKIEDSLGLFEDPEIEQHFINQHNTFSQFGIKNNPLILSFFFDTIVSFIFSFIYIILLNASYFSINFINFQAIIYLTLQLILIILLTIQNYYYQHYEKTLFVYIHHFYVRIPIVIIFSSMPTIIICQIYSYSSSDLEHEKVIILHVFLTFSFVSHLIYTGCYSFFRQITSIVLFLISIYVITNNIVVHKFNCYHYRASETIYFQSKVTVICDILTLLVLIIIITRNNEFENRACFLLRRETSISIDEHYLDSKQLIQFMDDIIPSFIFKTLETNQRLQLKNIKFNNSFKNVGILVMKFDNFYSTFYNEALKNGEPSLKVLHKCFCLIDECIMGNTELEKLWHYQTQYIVAAGINDDPKDDATNIAMLKMLVEMCWKIIKRLDTYSNYNIVGFDGIKLNCFLLFGDIILSLINGNEYNILSGIGLPFYESELIQPLGTVNHIVTTDSAKNVLKDNYKYKFIKNQAVGPYTTGVYNLSK